ncbi:MAG: hypothetical protein JO261_10545 [Alphaproteobacteria bacterium]|nr:hypothetical protein [Alphaproteobacteria bacterium]MBV9694124.1 hypothetical protein [Alphaproteobacteria bacterium]
MRILLAALAGAIAMFVWTSIAHMVTPLGSTGFSQIPNESAVLAQMDSSIGAKPGLYFFPWVDPKDPQMMQKAEKLERANPRGLLMYHPKGSLDTDMTPMLIKEFVKEFVQALIAAWIVMMIATSFLMRAMIVTAIGLSDAIATNVSYWVWYGFPGDYTLAQIIVALVGAFVAGLAIAAVLPRRTA